MKTVGFLIIGPECCSFRGGGQGRFRSSDSWECDTLPQIRPTVPQKRPTSNSATTSVFLPSPRGKSPTTPNDGNTRRRAGPRLASRQGGRGREGVRFPPPLG